MMVACLTHQQNAHSCNIRRTLWYTVVVTVYGSRAVLDAFCNLYCMFNTGEGSVRCLGRMQSVHNVTSWGHEAPMACSGQWKHEKRERVLFLLHLSMSIVYT